MKQAAKMILPNSVSFKPRLDHHGVDHGDRGRRKAIPQINDAFQSQPLTKRSVKHGADEGPDKAGDVRWTKSP